MIWIVVGPGSGALAFTVYIISFSIPGPRDVNFVRPKKNIIKKRRKALYLYRSELSYELSMVKIFKKSKIQIKDSLLVVIVGHQLSLFNLKS